MYSSERIIHEVGCWFSDDFSWARIAFFDGWIFISWIYVTITLILAQRLFFLFFSRIVLKQSIINK